MQSPLGIDQILGFKQSQQCGHEHVKLVERYCIRVCAEGKSNSGPTKLPLCDSVIQAPVHPCYHVCDSYILHIRVCACHKHGSMDTHVLARQGHKEVVL